MTEQTQQLDGNRLVEYPRLFARRDRFRQQLLSRGSCTILQAQQSTVRIQTLAQKP